MRRWPVVLLFSMFPAVAQASSLYYEISGGMAQIRNGDPFFGAGTPTPSNYGIDFDFGAAYGFMDNSGPLDIQAGIQTKYVNASGNGGADNYTLLAPYPMVRVQMMFVYATLGVTPYAWSKSEGTAGGTSLQKAAMSYALLGEAGALWAVTPKFSLGLGASYQAVNAGGTLSPNPILSLSMVMRFYFAFFSGHGGTEKGPSSGEFRGWRYPFGWQRGDN